MRMSELAATTTSRSVAGAASTLLALGLIVTTVGCGPNGPAKMYGTPAQSGPPPPKPKKPWADAAPAEVASMMSGRARL